MMCFYSSYPKFQIHIDHSCIFNLSVSVKINNSIYIYSKMGIFKKLKENKMQNSITSTYRKP